MTDTKERMSKQGTLLGPKSASKWTEWRRARDNRIQNPRRLKTAKDKDEKPDVDTSDAVHQEKS